MCDFCYRSDRKKKYVGTSYSLYVDLVQLFHRLYEKPDDRLSPIERELKYSHPDADQWFVTVQLVMNPDILPLEEAKAIVSLRMLVPEGLNSELSFQTREHWYEFSAWYKEFRKEREREGGRGEGERGRGSDM